MDFTLRATHSDGPPLETWQMSFKRSFCQKMHALSDVAICQMMCICIGTSSSVLELFWQVINVMCCSSHIMVGTYRENLCNCIVCDLLVDPGVTAGSHYISFTPNPQQRLSELVFSCRNMKQSDCVRENLEQLISFAFYLDKCKQLI